MEAPGGGVGRGDLVVSVLEPIAGQVGSMQHASEVERELS
jgi:hypothetical protein